MLDTLLHTLCPYFKKRKPLRLLPWLVLGLCLFLGKLFYREADVDALYFILKPTSLIVSLLTGLTFDYVPQQGFLNSPQRILVDKSCSGFNFYLICLASLSSYFFLHRKKLSQQLSLFGLCVLGAGLFTPLVNACRITNLLWLERVGWDVHAGVLHEIVGMLVYFGSLLGLHLLLSHRLSPSLFPSLKK